MGSMIPGSQKIYIDYDNVCVLQPVDLGLHYENMPIQIYWKLHHQKLKVLDKNSDIFIFLLKT